MTATPAAELVLGSANFGGGVDSVAATGGSGVNRTADLVRFMRSPARDASGTDDRPFVGVAQEMTRLLDPRADYPSEIAAALGGGDYFYVPCNTTDWFPLREKWERRWASEGIRRMEEGMATYARGAATLVDPWRAFQGPADEPTPFTGLVMTLPTVVFASDADRSSGWLTGSLDFEASASATEPATVRFRPATYSGNRDTDPRSATAHRVIVGEGLEFVLINVHLGTLRNENRGEILGDPLDELPRSVREATPEASYLRWLHFDLLARFIDDLYAAGLPAVVIGDLNATPDAAELRWFCARSRLRLVFDAEVCWSCGAPLGDDSPGLALYSSAHAKTVLTETAELFRELVPGDEPRRTTAREACPRCSAVLFTHKRNFRLIDNILHTDPAASRELGLTSTLDITDGPGAAGIRLDTYFSDHLPVWCRLRCRPL